MSNKTARNRRRKERQHEEMSLTERGSRIIGRYLSLRKLAVLSLAAAAVVGAIFLAQALGGGAEQGRIIDPVRNERTQDVFVGASVGQLAPNFEAQDLDGSLVRLSDFQGEPVILNFWATWCTACRAEIPALQQVFEERKDQDLVVIGVDWGEGRVGTARDYMGGLGATYLTAMDPDGGIGQGYRVRGLPVTLAIDSDGVIRELLSGELTYRAFDRLAQLALDEIEDLGEDIGPVGDITAQEESEG